VLRRECKRPFYPSRATTLDAVRGELTVFQSHESHPDADCAAATAVVAAESRLLAVTALRSAGFAAGEVKVAKAGSAEERAALAQPGVVVWCDWVEMGDVRAWHLA
jgi:hypothetical protein